MGLSNRELYLFEQLVDNSREIKKELKLANERKEQELFMQRQQLELLKEIAHNTRPKN